MHYNGIFTRVCKERDREAFRSAGGCVPSCGCRGTALAVAASPVGTGVVQLSHVRCRAVKRLLRSAALTKGGKRSSKPGRPFPETKHGRCPRPRAPGAPGANPQLNHAGVPRYAFGPPVRILLPLQLFHPHLIISVYWTKCL